MTKNLTEELQRTARQAMSGLHPVAQGEEAGGLPFRRLLAAAFRARFLVFGTTLFGLLIGAFLAITTPNTYLSTGKFLLTGSGAESNQVDPTRSTAMSQESIATAAQYVLNTDDLLQRVVDRVTPARILEPYTPGTANDSGVKSWFFRVQRDWNATKEVDRTPEGALKQLKRTVSVERVRFSDVLIATCSANSQTLAKEILATYMDEAVKWHIEKYDNPKVYEELGKAVEEAEAKRTTAGRAMRDFLDLKALVSDYPTELQRLKDDDSEAAAARRLLEQTLSVKTAQAAQLAAELADDKMLPHDKIKLRKADNSATEKAYADKIVTLDAEVARLKALGSRDAEEKERQIEHLRASMAQVKKDADEAPPVSQKIENPSWRLANDKFSTLQQEIGLMSAELKQRTERQQPSAIQLKKMLALEPEFLALRDADLNAEKVLTEARESWRQAQQKKLLKQGNFSTLLQIESASYPLEKEAPNRGKLLLGGFFVGLFLGLGIVVLRSLPDTVVRTRDDLEHLEGLPVIGIMPRLDGTNLRRHISLREQGW